MSVISLKDSLDSFLARESKDDQGDGLLPDNELKALRTTLQSSTSKDLPDVLNLWKKNSDPRALAVIEDWIRGSLLEIKDIGLLLDYWQNVETETWLERIFEERIDQLAREVLSGMEMAGLLSLLENIAGGVVSASERLIELEMLRQLKAVSPQDVPDWFEGILKNEELQYYILPEALHPFFVSKAKEIRASLD